MVACPCKMDPTPGEQNSETGRVLAGFLFSYSPIVPDNNLLFLIWFHCAGDDQQ